MALREMSPRVVRFVLIIAVLVAVVTIYPERDHSNRIDLSINSARDMSRSIPPRLMKSSRISGTVVDSSNGAVIRGALVALTRVQPESFEIAIPAVLVTADTTGRWTADALMPGEYQIGATAAGFLPSAITFIVTPEGNDDDVLIAMMRGGTNVTGRVRDTDGSAIAGVQVIARDVSHGRPLITITNVDGSYLLQLAAGSYALEATHLDYVRAKDFVDLQGIPRSVDFILSPGAAIRGRVVERATNDPIGDAHIQSGDATLAKTDQDGTFTITQLTEGEYSLVARAAQHATRHPTRVRLAAGQHLDDVDLVVDRAFSIAGRVLDESASGTGIRDARVRAVGEQGLVIASEPTDRDGSFELFGLLPGSYAVFAFKPGFLQSRPKEIALADKSTRITLTLRAGVTVSGRVEPPGVAKIGLLWQPNIADYDPVLEANATASRAESSLNGEFTLKNVPNGRFEITALTKDGHRGSLPILVADRDESGVVIRVVPQASIIGRVVDSNHRPVEGVHVRARRLGIPPSLVLPTDGNFASATSTVDGNFEIVGLQPGHYSVYADRATTADVHIDDTSEYRNVTIVVDSRDAFIRGRVVGLNREPMANVLVTAARESPGGLEVPSTRERSVTDKAGHFEIGGLRPGSYTLTATDGRSELRGATSKVTPGETATVVLETLGKLVIEATQDGRPMQFSVRCVGVTVFELVEEQHIALKHTFELPAGKFECTVDSSRGFGRQNVTVRSGATETININLQAAARLTGTLVSVFDGSPVSGIQVAVSGIVVASDRNGAFSLERVPPGNGKLMIVAMDQRTYGVQPHSYVATPGEHVDLGRIAVLPHRTGEEGTIGLATRVSDTELIVASIQGGGAAQAAGIRVGDQVVSINGLLVEEVDLQLAARSITSGNVAAGQVVVLGLARGVLVPLRAQKWL